MKSILFKVLVDAIVPVTELSFVQVLKMAKELARLHREHTKAQVQQASQERSRVESETVAALVESQSRKAREDREELQRLKDQLDLLQLREQESMTVTATKQQSGHISPRKVESMSLPDHSLLSLRTANVPKLDLSKTQNEKDGITHTDLRIFQVCFPYYIFVCFWKPVCLPGGHLRIEVIHLGLTSKLPGNLLAL